MDKEAEEQYRELFAKKFGYAPAVTEAMLEATEGNAREYAVLVAKVRRRPRSCRCVCACAPCPLPSHIHSALHYLPPSLQQCGGATPTVGTPLVGTIPFDMQK